MGSTEARVDYMGSSILMGIFSNADLKLQDEWKVNLYTAPDLSMADKRYSGRWGGGGAPLHSAWLLCAPAVIPE